MEGWLQYFQREKRNGCSRGRGGEWEMSSGGKGRTEIEIEEEIDKGNPFSPDTIHRPLLHTPRLNRVKDTDCTSQSREVSQLLSGGHKSQCPVTGYILTTPPVIPLTSSQGSICFQSQQEGEHDKISHLISFCSISAPTAKKNGFGKNALLHIIYKHADFSKRSTSRDAYVVYHRQWGRRHSVSPVNSV